ncbi:flagellar filament capping protein FliD [Rhodoferax aquaticus]|uniref:Flagellar hook-associated protein 2 C-terminal domain-containing protein n=1 Tax=Rhodoferax aquaticus TaxID=2527691 RepID=A0A515EL92_9BURK|nr:flagellar filament capping protein FliD [Rhodoferax aquaticus]QDL53433.1 hypothetical protein EXZ61_04155 [Rhodoferax aquaticus]
MNISDVLSSHASSLNKSSTSGAKASSAVAGNSNPLQRAGSRLQAQIDSTSAQLSSFGRLKSSVSDTQLAAKALAGLPSTASDVELKAAVAKLAAAYNASLGAARTTADKAGMTSEARGALNVGMDLRRAIKTDTATADAMRGMGFVLKSDGTVTVDDKKLDAALKANPAKVRAAMSKVGGQINTVATKELAKDGTMAGSLDSLTRRAGTLQTQATAMSKVMAYMANQA